MVTVYIRQTRYKECLLKRQTPALAKWVCNLCVCASCIGAGNVHALHAHLVTCMVEPRRLHSRILDWIVPVVHNTGLDTRRPY